MNTDENQHCHCERSAAISNTNRPASECRRKIQQQPNTIPCWALAPLRAKRGNLFTRYAPSANAVKKIRNNQALPSVSFPTRLGILHTNRLTLQPSTSCKPNRSMFNPLRGWCGGANRVPEFKTPGYSNSTSSRLLVGDRFFVGDHICRRKTKQDIAFQELSAPSASPRFSIEDSQ